MSYLSNQNVHLVFRGIPVSSVFWMELRADLASWGLLVAEFSSAANCKLAAMLERNHVTKTKCAEKIRIIDRRTDYWTDISDHFINFRECRSRSRVLNDLKNTQIV